MAKVRIYRDEAGGDELPRVCVRCGADADTDRKRTFSWVPPWVGVLILGGLLPWLIVASVLRKSMTISLPVCRGHRNHWLNRQLYMWLGLSWWVAVIVVAVAFGDQLPKDVVPAVIGGIVFGGLGWLIGGLVYLNTGIKPREITDRWAELVGVSPAFAEAWDEVKPPVVPVVRRRRRPARRDDEYDEE